MGWIRDNIETWNWRADRIGEASLNLLVGVQKFYLFMSRAFLAGLNLHWFSRPAVYNVLVRQVYFTGVQGLPWIIFIALTVGIASVYQIVVFSKGVEDLSLIGLMLNEVLVQEMAPVFVTIILLARSGVAVVTEIGNMHVRGEELLLKSLGISLHEYLYLPRLTSFALCGVILTALFVGISLWVGGLFVSFVGHQMQFTQFLFELQRGVSLDGLMMMTLKGVLYPLTCCGMLLFQGCRVGRDPNQIPVRATNGVLGSLVTIVIIDVLIVFIRTVV